MASNGKHSVRYFSCAHVCFQGTGSIHTRLLQTYVHRNGCNRISRISRNKIGAICAAHGGSRWILLICTHTFPGYRPQSRTSSADICGAERGLLMGEAVFESTGNSHTRFPKYICNTIGYLWYTRVRLPGYWQRSRSFFHIHMWGRKCWAVAHIWRN